MRRLTVLLFGILLFSSFKANTHDFYLSVTEVNYKKEKQSLQITTRVFIDDFEEVLKKRYSKDIRLTYKEDLKTYKSSIEKYMTQKLELSADGKILKIKFLGSKFDADQLILFSEVVNVSNFKSVQVKNSILTDLYDAQKNIVHVNDGNEIKSLLLLKEKDSDTVDF